jgi:VanZ family protein
MTIIFKFFWPSIAWAVFIFIMCTIKIDNITHSPLFFAGFDKLVHCGFFFVQVVLFGYGLIRLLHTPFLGFSRVLIVTAIAIAYGSIIEILQHYLFTWRSGEWDDLFADAVGASMGAFSILTIFKALSYVKK